MDQVVDAPRNSAVLVVDDFLPPQQVQLVERWVIGQESQFTTSKVTSPSEARGAVDTAVRRSKLITEPGPLRQLFGRRLLSVADSARTAMGLTRLPVTDIDLQVTATNDGDFFRCHTDNAHATVAARTLTFVYFLHREPKPYRGGHLALYETTRQDGRPVRGSELIDIEPVRNRMVFFPSHLMHEVRTVECSSRLFVDSRFTINGWFITSPRSAVHALLHRRNRQLAGRRPRPGGR